MIEVYRSDYEGFGPTLAAEKLGAQGYELSHETLRLWLRAEGLWTSARKNSPYRKCRQRRSRFGELVQLDGSIHRWFGETLPFACLMNLVDDATGTTLSWLAEGETTHAAFILLKKWIELYGVPQAIYVDLKTVYVSPKTLTSEEKETVEAFTHFSKACAKLGIDIIKAYSPQAKGRVERNHAVYQDRFVKELKLRGITDIEKANQLLHGGFIASLNEKFSKTAQDSEEGHRDKKSYGDLEQILCWEYSRQIQNDWTLRFHNTHYQLLEKSSRPKQKVQVREHLDGTISLWQGEKRLDYQRLPHHPKPVAKHKTGYNSFLRSVNARKNKHKTPWIHFELSNKQKPGSYKGTRAYRRNNPF